VKTTALGSAALKTNSKCSLAKANSAFSFVFALPNLRSLRFHSVSKATIGATGFDGLVF
jgi:hypothetical protein